MKTGFNSIPQDLKFCCELRFMKNWALPFFTESVLRSICFMIVCFRGGKKESSSIRIAYLWALLTYHVQKQAMRFTILLLLSIIKQSCRKMFDFVYCIHLYWFLRSLKLSYSFCFCIQSYTKSIDEASFFCSSILCIILCDPTSIFSPGDLLYLFKIFAPRHDWKIKFCWC